MILVICYKYMYLKEFNEVDDITFFLFLFMCIDVLFNYVLQSNSIVYIYPNSFYLTR